MENILIPGGKLELNEITANKEKNTISYLSQIYDIDEDTGRVSVAMPYSEGRMVVLSIGTHYNAYFYCKAKMLSKDIRQIICLCLFLSLRLHLEKSREGNSSGMI